MCLVPTIGKHFRACARAARRAHYGFIRCRGSITGHYPKFLRNAAVIGALLSPAIAQAGVMTIDFPQDVAPSTTVNNGNAVADGFRISPSSEYTLVTGGAGFGVIDQGIGWDSDGPLNQHYLGANAMNASLFVDDSGTPFSLLNVTFVAAILDDKFTMTSSKGGVFDVPKHLDGTFSASFSADPSLWTDISWLTFSYDDAGAPTAGLDQLVLSVDEPQTLALLGFGFLLLLGLQRMPVRARRSR